MGRIAEGFRLATRAAAGVAALGSRSTRHRGRSLFGLALLTMLLVPSPAGAVEVSWGGSGCTQPVPGAARTSATCGATLQNGRAVAPPGAPPIVRAVIAAANQIDGRPYVWGGGHVSFFTHGYDCSGAVSYALHGGDLLGSTMVSGQLAYWGAPGAGEWITVYANAKHVYMEVAGLRYDTRDDPAGVSGPRWHPVLVNSPNFAVRHAGGL